MDLLRYFEKQQTQTLTRPRLKAGDVVRVETKIEEGDKSRLQSFEGTVLGIRGSGPSATFTVRRETGRFAVERIFPLYSPLITDIAITKRQKVRRAKLTYLRHAGRQRVKEDELAMQRHRQEQDDQKRLAAAAVEAKAKEAEATQRAEAEAAQAKKAESAAAEAKADEGSKETTENK